MKSNITKILLASALCSTLNAFDFGAIANEVLKSQTTQEESVQTKSTTLSESTVTLGLKEALSIGVKYAVKELGAKDGYLNNKDVKIPLPQNLSNMETIIRKAGGEKIADDLINSMNNAATEATPKTASIFLDSIKNMSIEDAKGILAGNEDAATEYFQTNTTDKLKHMIKPIVQKSMQNNSVASYYDTFNSYYKQYGESYIQNNSVMNLAKNYGVDGFIPKSSDEKLDDYITNKAIDGLFKMVADKESQIRTDTVSQTTSLLKQVFSN